jgi:ABC-type nitrate/sulfonate/bicarbonate transport system ATPase subunit
MLMTYRPGTIRSEFNIDLPRPRHIEDLRVANLSGGILDELRAEINKAVAAEYGHVPTA